LGEPPERTQPRPSIIHCHGSYHIPAPYQAGLQKQGYDTCCPRLPTSDFADTEVDALPPPSTGWPQQSDDAVLVRNLINTLIEEKEKRVLVVGHSSGGFTATEDLPADLLEVKRRAKGEKGGVIGLLYWCAFLIPLGESISSYFNKNERDGSSQRDVPASTYVHHPTNSSRSRRKSPKVLSNPCIVQSLNPPI